MTQQQRVMDYLKEHKIVSSNELRNVTRIVDIPKCISILVDKGYKIESKRNKDGTATYYWGEKPKTQAKDYIFTADGRAIPVENAKPEQLKI